MIQIRNFINGQWQEETGGKTVPLYNPSTGETIGSVPVSNMETCEAAIATAAEAYKTWRLVPIAKRMTYIHKIRECMIRDLEKLAQGIALDQRNIFPKPAAKSSASSKSSKWPAPSPR